MSGLVEATVIAGFHVGGSANRSDQTVIVLNVGKPDQLILSIEKNLGDQLGRALINQATAPARPTILS